MQWAIVNLSDMPILSLNRDIGQWESINAIPGTIINMVVYEEGADWEPPENTKLIQVDNTAKIGDTGY